MPQFTIGTIDPNTKSGTQLAADLTQWKDAVHSGHKGSSRPSYAQAGQIWIDDSSDPTWRIYLFDGTNDILLRSVNISTDTAIIPLSLGGTGGDSAATARSSLGLLGLAIKDKVATGDFNAGAVTNNDVANFTLTIGKFANTTPNRVFGTNSSGVAVELESTKEIEPTRKVLTLPKGSFGEYFGAFTMVDGTIRTTGHGGNYRNGDPSGGHRYVPLRLAFKDGANPTIVHTEINAYDGYALADDGNVWSWGYNVDGELGHGDTTGRYIAEKIQYFEDNTLQITEIVPGANGTGEHQSVWFITTDGDVYACGDNANGQLGNGDQVQQKTPVRCGTITDVTQLEVGAFPYSVFALTSSGTMYAWGYNVHGQLGLGDTTLRDTPIEHTLLTGVTLIHVSTSRQADGNGGGGCVFAVDSSGQLWGTGYNFYYNLGLGDNTNRTAFTQVSTLTDTVEQIASAGGLYATIAVVVDAGGGTKNIWTWGYGAYGAHGQGSTSNITLPTILTGDFQGSVTEIKGTGSGSYGSMYLKSGNQLWATGYNSNGNLGVGDSTHKNVFTKVLGISGTISNWRSGGERSRNGLFVLYDDGRVDACGHNGYGERGVEQTNLNSLRMLQPVRF